MRNTIKKHADFAMTDNDLMARSAFFLVRAKPAKFDGDARYGLIVTKRLYKHAVDRNRAKRLLRDWIAFNERYMAPDMDYIFIARGLTLTATRDDGRTAMRKALHYIAKVHREQKNSKK